MSKNVSHESAEYRIVHSIAMNSPRRIHPQEISFVTRERKAAESQFSSPMVIHEWWVLHPFDGVKSHYTARVSQTR